MLSDQELTEWVRYVPSGLPKNNVTASFSRTAKLSIRWNVGIRDETLHIFYPDYLREAPCNVIMDIAKQVIQRALYDSDAKLSQETVDWLKDELRKPENVQIFCDRNKFQVIRHYNDAVVVTSDGDVVDTFLLFRVIEIPRKMAESPEIDKIIAREYESMFSEA